jgi:hypothetical protein
VPASPIEALSIGILSGVPVLLWGTKTYRRFLGSAGAGTFSRYNPNRAIVSSIVSAGGDVLSKSLSIFFNKSRNQKVYKCTYKNGKYSYNKEKIVHISRIYKCALMEKTYILGVDSQIMI